MSQDNISNRGVDLEQDSVPLDTKLGAIQLCHVKHFSSFTLEKEHKYI